MAKPATAEEVKNKVLGIRSNATPQELRVHISELCKKNGYDPVQSLLHIIKASGGTLAKSIREIAERVTREADRTELNKIANVVDSLCPEVKDVIGIHKELLQYIAPKLRSLDVSGSIDQDISITIKTFSPGGRNDTEKGANAGVKILNAGATIPASIADEPEDDDTSETES